ncbi:MAG TPA: DegT/DnrJ/EryC1/StrS family aminotransferase [Thermoanaerobaculia bacterium]|nr:DegT/DnrJ/EryC1/StrS family aminotransferase [Thermoanaerobaculia bacterium]
MIPLSRATVTPAMKQAMLDVVDSGVFILGPETRAFEDEFARSVGVRHAVAVSQGTSAIQLALLAVGITSGAEVLVPSMTAFPTVEGIVHAGGRPVFVDIDRFAAIDPADAARRITPRTAGIVPVHLYGGVADLSGLQTLAASHNIWIVEDCCQAHGARLGEKAVGSIGRAGCFSFYPSKNLTVFGDGGMVTTDDAELARRVRLLRDHGRTDKYTHAVVGYNLRFNEVQAAVGRKQLALLEEFVSRRRAIARRYDAAFALLSGIRCPPERPGTRMAYHLYPIRLPDSETRDRLRGHLKARGIESGVHYPIPNHLQPAMAGMGTPPSLPESEALAKTTLSLPMFPGLADGDVDAVIAAVQEFHAAPVRSPSE